MALKDTNELERERKRKREGREIKRNRKGRERARKREREKERELVFKLRYSVRDPNYGILLGILQYSVRNPFTTQEHYKKEDTS